jgi:hypothetical protein
MSLRVHDVYGNNAVIACPACGKPYLVTDWNEAKRGARPCPHCHAKNGIRFADAKKAFTEARSGLPKLERTTRLLFNKDWEGQGVMCQFTAPDSTVYRYHHDDLLRALVANGSNLKNTRSWLEGGLYHFPRLSALHQRLLEPYRIGQESLSERQKVGLVLRYLNKRKQRCTYGAFADAIGVNVKKVAGLLGERRPEASWVVNRETLKPTGYEPEQEHPDLYKNDEVITSARALVEAIPELQGFESDV